MWRVCFACCRYTCSCPVSPHQPFLRQPPAPTSSKGSVICNHVANPRCLTQNVCSRCSNYPWLNIVSLFFSTGEIPCCLPPLSFVCARPLYNPALPDKLSRYQQAQWMAPRATAHVTYTACLMHVTILWTPFFIIFLMHCHCQFHYDCHFTVPVK